jgi:hypothetical protein
VSFTQVTCPTALINNTHCARADDGSGLAAPAPVAGWNVSVPLSGSPIVSSSSATQKTAVTTSVQHEPASSSTAVADVSTQLPSSNITTLSSSTTISAHLEIATVIIDACIA